MPKYASTINQTLTNFARGVSQDLGSKVAEFVAPTVRVTTAHGQYKSYSDKNMFQALDTARAIGGPATRINFEGTDPYYNCQPQALEIPVDQAEVDPSDPLGIKQVKTKTLVTTATLSHEVKVLNVARAAVAATAGKGVWSNAEADPIAEIDEQIQAIVDENGILPNRLLMGLSAWAKFKNHPLVLERAAGAAIKVIDFSNVGQLFLNPAMQFKIGMLSRDKNKFGKGKDAENIVGAELLLFYADENPTTYDASAFKTFTVAEGGVDVVREYPTPDGRANVLAVDWSEDVLATSPAMARRIVLT